MNLSALFSGLGVVCVIAACQAPAVPKAEAQGPECPTTGARECKDANDCGSDLHCTGGRCFANQAGCACSEAGDCGTTAHCTKGVCYPNAVGFPCNANGAPECGRGHCTGGGCYANNTGSPCSADTECGAGSSCVNGTCN